MLGLPDRRRAAAPALHHLHPGGSERPQHRVRDPRRLRAALDPAGLVRRGHEQRRRRAPVRVPRPRRALHQHQRQPARHPGQLDRLPQRPGARRHRPRRLPAVRARLHAAGRCSAPDCPTRRCSRSAQSPGNPDLFLAATYGRGDFFFGFNGCRRPGRHGHGSGWQRQGSGSGPGGGSGAGAAAGHPQPRRSRAARGRADACTERGWARSRSATRGPAPGAPCAACASRTTALMTSACATATASGSATRRPSCSRSVARCAGASSRAGSSSR